MGSQIPATNRLCLIDSKIVPRVCKNNNSMNKRHGGKIIKITFFNGSKIKLRMGKLPVNTPNNNIHLVSLGKCIRNELHEENSRNK